MPQNDLHASESETGPEFAGLGPPRFSLRFLLFAPVILCGFIILMKWFGALVGAIFVLALLAILLHIAGNAIGTRLRENADGINFTAHLQEGKSATEFQRNQKPSEHFAQSTKLSDNSPLGLPLLVATLFGVTSSAVVGFFILNWMYPNELPIIVMGIGVASAAILGGFCFYWVWSLLQVLTTSWWQAHSSAAKDAKASRDRRR